MDDNHSTQQSSQQRSNLQLARARRRGLANSSTLNSVLAVLWSPWLLWPLLWLILLLAATISVFSLTFTGFVDRPESAPPVVQVPEAASSGSDRLVIWVVGAIVVCAAGYWVVFRQLKGSSQPKRKRQRRQRRARNRQQVQILQAQQPSTTTHVEPPTIVEPEPDVSIPTPKTSVVEVIEPQSPEPPVVEVTEPNPGSESNGSREDPVITILPPEDTQQVDVAKVSLAEMMDIRKRRSLASILGKTDDEDTED